MSDENGVFQLDGMPKGLGNRIQALPSRDRPYLPRVFEVPDPSGIDPISMDLELHRGVFITGRVTDKVTGEPKSSVRLYYWPYRSNKRAQELPEYDENGSNLPSFINQNRHRTDEQGFYRIVGLPGRSIIGAHCLDQAYRSGSGAEAIGGLDENGYLNTYSDPLYPGTRWPHTIREVDVPEDAESAQCDLELDPGRVVKLAHEGLLREFSSSLAAFLEDLESCGLGDQVLVLAFSEFGRRVKENGSLGTDHGAAAPSFLAGSGLTTSMFGPAPDLEDLDDGDLRMTVDFRRVYATVLESWLGIPHRTVVGDGFPPLPMLRA